MHYMTESKVARGVFTITDEETESPGHLFIFLPRVQTWEFHSINSTEGCLVTGRSLFGGKIGKSLMTSSFPGVYKVLVNPGSC